MNRNRIVIAGSFVFLATLVGTSIRAQLNDQMARQSGVAGSYSAVTDYNPGTPTYPRSGTPPGSAGTAGSSTAPITCPLADSAQAATSNCVTVVIQQGATGQGTAAFGANPLSVGLGTTVIWYNDDTIPHTVTADDGSFDSATLQAGDYFAHTFNTSGLNTYYCAIHGARSMSGAVSVSSTKAAAVPCAACQAGATPVPLPTITIIPVPIPTLRPTPSVRPSPSITPSPSPRPSPSITPSSSPSPYPSSSPSPTITPSGTPSPRPSPSGTP